MRKQKKRGFTLIELIVVIAILVALLLILVPRLTGFTSTAAEVQCRQTRQKVMEMVKAYEIKGEPVSITDLLANKDDEYFISSGGKLTALEIKGVVTFIKCSIHGSNVANNLDTTPIGIRNTTMGIIEFLQNNKNYLVELTGNAGMNNSAIRNFIRDTVYGGSWPSLDQGVISAAGLSGDLKIQICYNNEVFKDNIINNENAIIYASSVEGKGKDNWGTNLIYNPTDNQWYTGKTTIYVMNHSWKEVSDLMSANNWKPVEYTE